MVKNKTNHAGARIFFMLFDSRMLGKFNSRSSFLTTRWILARAFRNWYCSVGAGCRKSTSSLSAACTALIPLYTTDFFAVATYA